MLTCKPLWASAYLPVTARCPPSGVAILGVRLGARPRYLLKRVLRGGGCTRIFATVYPPFFVVLCVSYDSSCHHASALSPCCLSSVIFFLRLISWQHSSWSLGQRWPLTRDWPQLLEADVRPTMKYFCISDGR